ncbi:MAG: hypothetical protein WBG01_11090 [Bacteroidota bacterium]
MKSTVIVISAVLFIALMLTSCQNYYNPVEPDIIQKVEDQRTVDGEQDPPPKYSHPGHISDTDVDRGGSSEDPYRVDLIADGGDAGGLDVGDVLVWNDADYIYMKYLILDNDWCLTKISLEVARSLDEIPQVKGNPKPGQFTWKADLGGLTEYTEVVPMVADPGLPVRIAAYASVSQVLDPDISEGAWGEGRDFPGKSWAMYFTYMLAFTDLGEGGDTPASDEF